MNNSAPRPSRPRAAHPYPNLPGFSRRGGAASAARAGASRLADGDETSGAAWHQLHRHEILRLLEVDLPAGLDAGEVLRRREKYGLNSITPRPGLPAWVRFLRQFNQPLVYLLLVAVVVTGWMGEWVDSSVIFGVIFLNAIVGFIQESKAESAIESLSRMVTATVTVRRNSRRHRIPSEELVPGDVVLLEAGDRVGADLRLFEVRELNVDESTLTGESVAVLKHTDALALDTVLADRRNLAFAGTIVTSGYGEGVVWATGDRTETGRIAWLVAEAVDLSTPLTRKIALDARIILQDSSLTEMQLPKLAIRPYPENYVGKLGLADGTSLLVRPIRPEDEPLMVKLHEQLSDRTVTHRFFAAGKSVV